MERKILIRVRDLRWKDAHTLFKSDNSVVSPEIIKLMEDNPSIITPGGNALAIQATLEEFHGRGQLRSRVGIRDMDDTNE